MIDKVLQALNAEDDAQFKLHVLEALGELVLMIHWLRGTFNWMMHTGVVKWPSAKDKANYERLFGNIALYEGFVWETAPSRAMTVALREFRKTGQIDENFPVLLKQDFNGRIPYDITPDEQEAIRQILGQLSAQRDAREGETYDDYIDIMRRLGEVATK